jgi:hypothetical protein
VSTSTDSCNRGWLGLTTVLENAGTRVGGSPSTIVTLMLALADRKWYGMTPSATQPNKVVEWWWWWWWWGGGDAEGRVSGGGTWVCAVAYVDKAPLV